MWQFFRITIAVLLAFLVMELVAREVYSVKSCYDPALKRDIFEPGVPLRYWREGNGTTFWTSNGIRRVSYNPAESDFKILALGDSYAEALQVDAEKSYDAIAEKYFRSKGMPVSILNLGKSGYSFAGYVAEAQRLTELFNPAWTIIQVSATDFFSEAWDRNSSHFYWDTNKSLCVTAYSTKRPLNEQPFLLRLTYNCANVSSLFRLTCLRLKEIHEWVRNEPPLFFAASATNDKPNSSSDYTSYPLAEEMRLLKKAYNGRVTLLFLTRYDLKIPHAIAEREKAIIEAARQEGIKCITPDWEKSFRNTGFAPYGFPNSEFNRGHLNERGHRAVAECVIDEIEVLRKQNGIFQP